MFRLAFKVKKSDWVAHLRAAPEKVTRLFS